MFPLASDPSSSMVKHVTEFFEPFTRVFRKRAHFVHQTLDGARESRGRAQVFYPPQYDLYEFFGLDVVFQV